MNTEKNIRCIEREEAITLAVCGELEPDAIAELDSHLAKCLGCAEAFAAEQKLHESYLLNAGAEPSQAMLAECRAGLDVALDRASQPGFWTRVWAGFSKGGWAFAYRNWLAMHPAMGAAVFVVAGVLIGNLAPRWFEDSGNPGGFEQGGREVAPAMVVRGNEAAARMGVRGITLQPSGVPGEGIIVVQGVRETPMRVQGSPDEPMIRQVLLDILPNGRQFDLDTRLLALEMLGPRSANDTEVRDSLCKTARTDVNPTVRLKALEALKGLEQDETVRQAFMQALLNDTNPGVRIAAIGALREFAEKQNSTVDQQMVDVFRERMEKDPNTYIRVQSAAAMRQLAQRGVY